MCWPSAQNWIRTTAFKHWIQKVKQVTLGAYDHQLYPFDQLVDDLQWQRDRSRHPLFDVLIDLHNHNRNSGASAAGGGQDALRLSSYTGSEQRVSKFDLATLSFTETQEGLNLLLEYNSDLFNQSTIERMQQHIAVLLQSVITHPSIPIHQLEYIDQKGKSHLAA